MCSMCAHTFNSKYQLVKITFILWSTKRAFTVYGVTVGWGELPYNVLQNNIVYHNKQYFIIYIYLWLAHCSLQ